MRNCKQTYFQTILKYLIFFLIFSFPLSVFAQSLQQCAEAAGLDAKVLNTGLTAYKNAQKLGLDKQGILSIIDYSKPSTDPRLWVINLKTNEVVFHTLVAHGKGSGMNYAETFSDKPRSDASSIGVYLTGNTYMGKHGYSMRLLGLEKGFNDKAYSREIVMHSAPYVSDTTVKQLGRLGRSWGCPALDQKIASQVINTIKNGTLLVAYYPDKRWLNSSQFL